MTPHTPGPWYVSGPFAGFGSLKQAGTDALIFGIARGDPDEAQSVESCEANANLIAAAPDGYAAGEYGAMVLRETANILRGHSLNGCGDICDAAALKLETALAKARGQSPADDEDVR